MNKPIKMDAMVPMLADLGVSISELKKNPGAVVSAARGRQVAILNRNKPVAYVVSPEVWDHVLDVFDERRLGFEIEERFKDEIEDSVEVSLDDL